MGTRVVIAIEVETWIFDLRLVIFLLLPVTATVHDIVTRGGRCLIPVFALGRAQELLLILGMCNHIHFHLLVASSEASLQLL